MVVLAADQGGITATDTYLKQPSVYYPKSATGVEAGKDGCGRETVVIMRMDTAGEEYL